ncbi:hypothetical protein [Spiroplasma endosymbiont of Nebria brevicollis]|uniref:hypothetical protein n=1 Tax=Spiroplasma endosymbiont of Nebria brevicollis TaxID=3066284 RepID=UPI00313C818E
MAFYGDSYSEATWGKDYNWRGDGLHVIDFKPFSSYAAHANVGNWTNHAKKFSLINISKAKIKLDLYVGYKIVEGNLIIIFSAYLYGESWASPTCGYVWGRNAPGSLGVWYN